jgi:hypothetical protein
MKRMKPGGLALFFSNDIYPTSADGTLPFKQHADIFYLAGVDQEETVLLLFPDAHNPADREILFTLETNDELAIWEGAKLTKAQATAETGIANVQWTTGLERTLHRLMAEAQSLYLNDNQHTRARLTVETRTDRENAALRAKYPNHDVERSAPILHAIRAVKHSSEIDQMQRACDITKAGFDRVLQFVKPGVMEYEIEAEFMHEFLRRGSRGFAYTPIIGSGFNACVLHYIENASECQAGDVILMDVGADGTVSETLRDSYGVRADGSAGITVTKPYGYTGHAEDGHGLVWGRCAMEIETVGDDGIRVITYEVSVLPEVPQLAAWGGAWVGGTLICPNGVEERRVQQFFEELLSSRVGHGHFWPWLHGLVWVRRLAERA